MGIIKIISLSISALIVIILLKKINGDHAIFATIAINTAITAFSITMLKPIFDYIAELNSTPLYNNLFTIMFKTAGIALLCSFAAELCRDAEQGSLGSKIEFAAKCTLLTYTLPLIQGLFNYAKEFIN